MLKTYNSSYKYNVDIIPSTMLAHSWLIFSDVTVYNSRLRLAEDAKRESNLKDC